jgi:ABC-2 type transport system ATP-binding protein
MSVAIETNELSRHFEEKVAVDRITLAIPESTVFGFLGPNGAGKTTTVRMLAGLISPTSGDATVAGISLTGNLKRLRGSVGLLTESPGLYDQLTAFQNLLFFGKLYGLSSSGAKSQIEKYLKILELWDVRDQRAGTFSKGMRQKVAIARALLHEPGVIFLDEPTSGLDPAAARSLRDLIKLLRADGRTIFLTTHNLPEAEDLCDQIAIMKGSILMMGAQTEVRNRSAKCRVRLTFASDPSVWLKPLRSFDFVTEAEMRELSIEVVLDDPKIRNPILIRALAAEGANLYAVEVVQKRLEEIYLSLIGNANGASATKRHSADGAA